MWFYARDQQQYGPVSEEELRRLLQRGELSTEDLVWREGMPEWIPASSVAELATPLPPAPPASFAPPPAPPAYQPAAAFPASSPPAGAPVEVTNYLPWAIAATLLCCLPAGIGSIVYATQANSAKARGDWAAAQKAANSAKTWLIVSVVGGLLGTILIVIATVMGSMPQ